MSREFPDWINPWAAAQGRREFQGTWPLARMPRLASVLHDASGDARFSVRMSLDTDQRPNVSLAVESELTLMCQASLKPYTHQVRLQSELGVIEKMEEESLLPDHLDPVVVKSGRLKIVALVEDELLLALPQVPRNPDIEPVKLEVKDPGIGSDEPELKSQKTNPFAGLKALKSNQARETDQD